MPRFCDSIFNVLFTNKQDCNLGAIADKDLALMDNRSAWTQWWCGMKRSALTTLEEKARRFSLDKFFAAANSAHKFFGSINRFTTTLHSETRARGRRRDRRQH